MRILHVVESLDRGGLERVVVDLAVAQKAAGHEVAVLCLFRLGGLAAELGSAGIQVCTADKRPGFDFRAVMHLRSEIKRTSAEVLHSHNAVANYYSAIATLFHPELRLVNTRHGMGTAKVDRSRERLYRLSLCRTAAVAAVCSPAVDHFVEHRIAPRRKLHVVHNGIRLDKFSMIDRDEARSLRRRLEISENAFVAGTVGRLNWAKDQAMLIASFASMPGRSGDDRLIIVGEGELRAPLEMQIRDLGLQDSVLLLGDRNDVAALLAVFDVFVATSITEGYSIALLEAAAAGVPVIAADVGGNTEIVQDGTTGIVVRERTVECFVQALSALAVAPARREQMGHNARAWAAQHGSLARTVLDYEHLYSSVTDLPRNDSSKG